MPELPEVAGLAAFLDARLRGATLAGVQIASFAVLKTADPPYAALEGRRIAGVERYGKFVSLDAEGLHFVFHLAKAGWLRYTEPAQPGPARPGKMTAARLSLATAAGSPAVVDLTEAGTKKSLAVYVVRNPGDVPGVASLGPDPLGPGFALEMFAEIVRTSPHQIKGLLRNQGSIAGIGNAYSDEILHAARISPFAMAKSLDPESVRTLYESIHGVLGKAVSEALGKAPDELKDAKRSTMRVHGRTGQACPVCGDTVREVSFADTSLQYCATCQTHGKILADRRTSRFLK